MLRDSPTIDKFTLDISCYGIRLLQFVTTLSDSYDSDNHGLIACGPTHRKGQQLKLIIMTCFYTGAQCNKLINRYYGIRLLQISINLSNHSRWHKIKLLIIVTCFNLHKCSVILVILLYETELQLNFSCSNFQF